MLELGERYDAGAPGADANVSSAVARNARLAGELSSVRQMSAVCSWSGGSATTTVASPSGRSRDRAGCEGDELGVGQCPRSHSL